MKCLVKRIKLKRLNPFLRGLILKVPHLDLLLELDNEDHRSTPLRQSSSHPSYLIRLGETGYQPDDLGLGFEVVSRTDELVALVHVNHIVPREP